LNGVNNLLDQIPGIMKIVYLTPSGLSSEIPHKAISFITSTAGYGKRSRKESGLGLDTFAVGRGRIDCASAEKWDFFLGLYSA
jgi:hypothetical protein